MISSDILVVKSGSTKASKEIFTGKKHNLPHLIVLVDVVVVVIVHLKKKKPFLFLTGYLVLQGFALNV